MINMKQDTALFTQRFDELVNVPQCSTHRGFPLKFGKRLLCLLAICLLPLTACDRNPSAQGEAEGETSGVDAQTLKEETSMAAGPDATAAPVATPKVEIVRDGLPLAEIVVAEEPLTSVGQAVKDLQFHIEAMSGGQLPVVHKPTGNGVVPIYVGDSPALQDAGLTPEGLPLEAYRILVRPDLIAIFGRDEERPRPRFDNRGNPNFEEEWQEFSGMKNTRPPGVSAGHFNRELGIRTLDATATLYGVASFLEQLGVRWYFPYEDGTVIPSSPTLAVAEQDTEMAPKFPIRDFMYYNTMETDAEGVLWFKRMKYGASYLYSNDGHSTRNIVKNPEMEAAHPEFYARADGEILHGHDGGVPKLSNPGFRDISAEFVRKGFEAYPELGNMTLGMPDGFTKIDEEDARVWVKPDATAENRFSDYVWDYWLDMAARIKESNPGKTLTCYSYTTYQEPPSQVEKLPDNVGVCMVYGVSLSMLPIYRDIFTPMREKWLSMLTSDRFFIWEYCLYYRRNAPTVPVAFTKLLQQDMQTLNGICEGKFIEIMPDNNRERRRIAYPALTHMIHYLQGKLYWNPDLDLQALLDEFYQLYYGPGAPEMKQFWEFAEEVWTRPESRSITPTTGYLKKDDIPRYFDLLAQARSKVEPDSIYDRRLARLEQEMAPARGYFERLERTGPALTGSVLSGDEPLDGNLDKPAWADGPWYNMRELVSGGPVPDRLRTRVAFRLSPDRSHLLIGVECGEPEMSALQATATKHDDAKIFDDDVVEIYLESPERSHFKIVVNSDGTIFDESHDGTIVDRDTMPILWNPGIKAAVAKGPRGWSAEISIPTEDIGNTNLGPSRRHVWGVNVARLRHTSGEPEAFALSPTGKMFFGDLTKLGSLTIQ